MAARLFILLLMVIVVMVWVPPTRTQDQHQDANYHLTKLKQKVDEIKSSLEASSPHHVVKRAANRAKEGHADDLILNSLASYCSTFNRDPELAKYMEKKAQNEPLSSRVMGGHTRYIPPVPLPFQKHDFDAFPVSVLTQEGEDDKVWIVVNVAHSDTARVSKLDFYDFQEVVLEYPESSCRKIVSKARFVLQTEDCNKLEHFKISLGRNTNAVDLYIDVCELVEKSNGAIKATKLNTPFFSVETPVTRNTFDKQIFLGNDNENGTSFDVDLPLYSSTALEVSLILLDWESKETYQSSANLLIKYGDLKEIKHAKPKTSDEQKQLFTVEVLSNQCFLSDDENGVYLMGKQCIRLRINIDSMPGHSSVSGKMTFREYLHNVKRTSDMISLVELTVHLVPQQWHQDSFRTDLIHFRDITRFRCNSRGNMDHQSNRLNAHCVVQCHAYGQDISFLYITKKVPSPLERRFKSGSYVLPNSAAAILDVGQSEDDAEGEYECTVVNKRGQTNTQSLQLYTRRFTRIAKLDLESNDTKTAQITCRVYGDPSVEMSISVVDENLENKKVFNVSNYSTNLSQSDSGKTLSISLPWNELKFPREKLLCEAEGDRGADEDQINLKNYNQNKYGIFPQVNRTEMRVERFANNSFLASCSVTGKRPLKAVMSIDSFYLPEEILLQERYVESGDGEDEIVLRRVLTRFDENLVWENLYNWHLICRAHNEYGSKKQEYRDAFYLNT